MKPQQAFVACLLVVAAAGSLTAEGSVDMEVRSAGSEAETADWLQNMVWRHRYSDAEITAVLGLKGEALEEAKRRSGVLQPPPNRPADAPLLVLPYPGGRHPRLGFLDGAVNPQRETKVSVFAPWPDGGYAVVDVPEAIFCNLGLLYLAHTHVPTLWTERGVSLPKLEWRRWGDVAWQIERTLPNGVEFGAKIRPTRDSVRMRLWLKNGSDGDLSGLRVQNCVMLGRLKGFEKQTNDNKIFQAPYCACRSDDGKRWIITAWEPCHRAWGNPPCPCLHSDPKFPDCPRGKKQTLQGWLSFYEGTDLSAELRRIDATGWRTGSVK